ncbi:hypothetical protein BMT54_00415 [Pasteurellaceae bacterium 15-036681]|nr:hypothetical protein BMT54_00415 [Pasteurellaceae bacterium 15-036681]
MLKQTSKEIYNSLKTFLENPENVDAFIELDAIVWVDWRECDEDIVSYFNEKLDEKIEVQLVDNGKPYGNDISLKKDKIELEIPYEEEMDRDTTIKYLNNFIKPKYEIRWWLETLGNDTLGFVVLESNKWAELDQEFGRSKLNYYFSPIGIERTMFDLDMDEVFLLLELRSKNKNMDFLIIADWVRMLTKEKELKKQKNNGEIDLKKYFESTNMIKKIKTDFINKYKGFVL